MQRWALLAISAAILLTLSGCGDSHDAVAREGVATLKELSKTLEGVKDEASAKAASPRLNELADRMERLKERSDKLGKPSKETEEALKQKYQSEMQAVLPSLMGSMMRLAFNPNVAKHLPMDRFRNQASGMQMPAAK